MSQQAPVENSEILGELDAGVFIEKFKRAMADVALGVVTVGKPGKVVVTFDMTQIANSYQINIKHKISFVKPTGNGKASEENTTATAVYVGTGGKLTTLPESQTDLFKRKAEAAADRDDV